VGTKLLARSAVDYDAVVAPTGRHGFREEVASNLKTEGRGSKEQRKENRCAASGVNQI